MVTSFTDLIMDKSKPKQKCSVIRTLNLPRDFQLVLRKRDVSKVDATRGFGVRNRLYPGFWLAVKAVWFTAKAFAKYVALRLKRFVAKLESPAQALFRQSRPFEQQPLLFPPLPDLLFIFFFVWFSVVLAFNRRRKKKVGTLGDANVVRPARFGETGYDVAVKFYRRRPKYQALQPGPSDDVHGFLSDCEGSA